MIRGLVQLIDFDDFSFGSFRGVSAKEKDRVMRSFSFSSLSILPN